MSLDLLDIKTLQEALASRADTHYGVPVGAVLVQMRHANTFRKLLSAVPNIGKVVYRGIHSYPKVGDGFLLISLPCNASLALEPGSMISKDLEVFMDTTDTRFFPGVRLGDVLFGNEACFKYQRVRSTSACNEPPLSPTNGCFSSCLASAIFSG